MMEKTNNEVKNKREPIFHVSKNTVLPFWQKAIFMLIAIVIALLLIGVIGLLLIKSNPMKIYTALFKGPFIDIWTFLQNGAMLLGFTIAIVPAFRMKYFNMGANGCVLMSCAAAIACMKFLPEIKIAGSAMPNWLIIICMVVAGILASTIYSLIPALFKAFLDINETLFTLMSNYIAIKLVSFLIFVWDKSGSGTLNIVNRSTKIGWFPNIGNKYVLSIIVVAVLTVIIAIYLKFTKHGFEAALVGESVNTARYVGINDKFVMLRTIALCGVLCGILGVVYAGSISHTLTEKIGGLGFTAILVTWLSNFSPIMMVVISYLVVFLQTGTNYVSSSLQLGSSDFSSVCVGIMFFCVIGAQYFINYKVELTSRGRRIFGIKEKVKMVEGGIH